MEAWRNLSGRIIAAKRKNVRLALVMPCECPCPWIKEEKSPLEAQYLVLVVVSIVNAWRERNVAEYQR